MKFTGRMMAIASTAYVSLDCILIAADMYDLIHGLFA